MGYNCCSPDLARYNLTNIRELENEYTSVTSGIDIVSESPLSSLISCKRNSSTMSGNYRLSSVGHINSDPHGNDGPFCLKL